MIDISELAHQSGCPASKIRYYEEIGLIRSVGRKGLKRLFEPSTLMRLSIIRLAQIGKFSLSEIRTLIGCDGAPKFDRNALLAKADELEEQIGQLTTLREGLRHIANCQADSQLECPRFRRIMNIALQKFPPHRS